MPALAAASLLAISAMTTGCRSAAPPQRATVIDNNPGGVDPADVNYAPAGSQSAPQPASPAGGRVRALGGQQSYMPQQSVEQNPQQQPYQGPPPSNPQEPNQTYNNGYDANNDAGANDQGVAAGYEALAEATQPPPPLPEYEQPPCPEQNDLWTPGYWNYAPQGYFWVPGAWVAPPYAGALWTPAYWGYQGNVYRLHRGFWARHIGFYGGVNYGYGYTGSGYHGGYWNGNNFYYNRTVNRINVTNIHNVYEHTVVVNNINRVSYNGGRGGLQARPAPQELAVLHEQRLPPMATQVQLRQESAENRQQFFNENHGRPAQAVMTRPIAAERSPQPPIVPTRNVQPIEQKHLAQQPNAAQNQQFDQQRERQEQVEQKRQQQTEQRPQQNPRIDQQQPPQRPRPDFQQQNEAAQQQRMQQQQQQRSGQQQQAEQQRNLQQQQREAQQQRAVPQQQRIQPQPQRPEAQPRAEPQPRPQAASQPRPEPQPHPQPAPQAQHPAEAPHPAPAPHANENKPR